MDTTNSSAFQALTTGSDGATLVPFRHLTADGMRRVRQMYAALIPTRASLDALFALNAAQTAPTEQWLSFFIETASAHVIWDQRPTGRVTEEDARWLLAQFDSRPSQSTLALLLRVMEEAPHAPAWLAAAVRHRACAFRTAAEAGAVLTPAQAGRPHLRLVA